MSTFHDRVSLWRERLAARERAVADHLAEGYPHAGLESATAVGARLGVSPATVVRLIARLGYAGWADFQAELRGEVETRLASPLGRVERVADEPAADIVSRAHVVALDALNRTRRELEVGPLDAVVDAIFGAPGRVIVIGEKKGRAVALYLYSQLTMCRENVILFSGEASFDADRLLDVGPGDIVVAIDVRRYVESCVTAALWCRDRGARLVVIADAMRTPLCAASDLVLRAGVGGVSAFDSYAGLIFVADVITAALIARDPPKARERLARGEEAWARFRTFRTPA